MEGFNSKKLVVNNLKQGKEVESSKAKIISLIGIQRQKNGRYGAQIRDGIRHKKVWLGTFDTMEEASAAYFDKKSELKNEKLSCNGSTSCNPKSRRSFIGIRRRKSGRYQVSITDPIKHKSVYLGTFNTMEEASQAYLSKKSEFEKLRQQQCMNKQKKSEKIVNVKLGHETVNCEPFQPESAGGSSNTDVPFSNSSNGGTVQSIDSDKIGAAVEVFHDYQSKKCYLHSSKEVEQKSNMLTDSSSGEKQQGQEEEEDLWMGKWVQLPGDDRAVMFLPKLGLPIIDNYGYLLGEFSSLDDLSICVTEDDNQM